jgi:hypothetical protein
MARLNGLDVDECARLAFRNLVLDVGAKHGVKGLDRGEQLAYIRRLLVERISRPTIRDRISVRFGISARHSYRLIGEALKLGHKTPLIGTRTADNQD